MDMRLIDPTLPDDPNSKANRAIKNVIDIYRQEGERKGTQIVFADQYRQVSTDYLDAFAGGSFVPPTQGEDAEEAPETKYDADGNEIAAGDEDDGGFNLYRDIKEKLIKAGIPADEIAVATDYTTDEQRGVLFAKANAGKIRVLIGSTQKLGVGVNVQERLYAMHHLDTPWTPADLEQRIGRGWRSGNRYAEWGIPIQNLAYGVERTMDAGRYQVIETKSRFVKQAMEGKGGFEFEDPAGGLVDAAAELKAQFTGDPRVMELVALENQTRELELQRDAHQQRMASYASMLASSHANEARARQEAARLDVVRGRLAEVEKAGIKPEELDEINARIKAVEKEIDADGALQSEKARVVLSRPLADGINLDIYGSGEVNAQGKVAFRANAVLTVDGNPWNDRGITSERAGGLEGLLKRAVIRAEDQVSSYNRQAEDESKKQSEAMKEVGAAFPYEAELKEKQARVAEIKNALQGKDKKKDGEEGETPAAPAADAVKRDGWYGNSLRNLEQG